MTMGSEISSWILFRLLSAAWKRQALNRLRHMVHHSRLMLGVILAFITGYWVFFTWLFYRGLQFLHTGVPALGDLLVARMFYLLFGLIFFMLVVSSVIAGYGVFFKNRETAWIQTLPVSHGQLFRWKFVEMSCLASWAFVFLSGPLFLAYGWGMKLPFWFLLCLPVLYAPFSLLANTLGAAVLLALVYLWHQVWGRRVVVLGAISILVAVVLFYRPVEIRRMTEAEIVPLLNILLKNTRLAVEPILPSYWLATAVLGLGERVWPKVFFFFSLVLSYSLLGGWLLLRYCGLLFYENASRVQDRRLHGRAHSNRAYRSPLSILAGVVHGMWWLKLPVRSVLKKDVITFWRDTGQWSQFAIFFGLLAFYFLNIRNFRYQLEERFWVSVVAFLNLGSLSLILSTLTTRFVYPQFSLEGRSLWLLGLAPVRLKSFIWGKFWASTLSSCFITLCLMFFSFQSLNLDPELRWLIGFSICMMSVGLSGIAVGLGVLFPNMRQSAAQIVSGFGGTFCLVVSLAYIAISVMMVAIPIHIRFMAGLSLDFHFTSIVGVIYTMTFLIGMMAALIPMYLAQRKLKHFEC